MRNGQQTLYSFDDNGGSGGNTTQTVVYGVAENLDANSFTRTGYTFGGWATSSGSSSVAYTDGQSYTHNQAGNETLYAIWTANSYTVTFDDNGGSGGNTTQTVVYGVAENLDANSFTRTGYTFGGWATSSGSSSVAYTDGELYAQSGRKRDIVYDMDMHISTVSSQPSNGSDVCVGGNPSAMSVGASGGTSSYSYQWYSNGSNSNSGGSSIVLRTNSSYAPSSSSSGTTYYYVVITDANTCTVTWKYNCHKL